MIFDLTVKDTFEYAVATYLLLFCAIPFMKILEQFFLNDSAAKPKQNSLAARIQDIDVTDGRDHVLVTMPTSLFKNHPFLLSPYSVQGILSYHQKNIAIQTISNKKGVNTYIFTRHDLIIESRNRGITDAFILKQGEIQLMINPQVVKKSRQNSTADLITFFSVFLFCVTLFEEQVLAYTYPFIHNPEDMANFVHWLTVLALSLGVLAYVIFKSRNSSVLMATHASILFVLSFYIFGGCGIYPLL
ncbi:MAG: hypothetical protein NTV00_06575 [Methylococcales bacterium]|nr:hypothetical protein [Methylococcales bacterium]